MSLPRHRVVPGQACDTYVPKSHTETCSKHMATVFYSEGPGLPQTHCDSAPPSAVEVTGIHYCAWNFYFLF